MTSEEYMALKVGDTVYDSFKRREMRVKRVYQDNEPAIQFEWVETCTIYAHSSSEIIKLGENNGK